MELSQIISESTSRWRNDPYYSNLLVAQLQNIFHNFEDVRLSRHIDKVLQKIYLKQESTGCMKSGSAAEGVQLPSSDIDIMYWNKHHIIIQEHEHLPVNCVQPNVLRITSKLRNPGYVGLEILKDGTPDISASVTVYNNRRFLSSTQFQEYHFLNMGTQSEHETMNGPCIRTLSCLGSETDNAFCLRCPFWPDDVTEYITRDRKYNWPPDTLIQQIRKKGIHLVPIGSRQEKLDGSWSHDPLEWRYSFSYAETELIHSFNAVQLRIYGLLKIILNDVLKRQIPEGGVCSYYMKTIMLWTVEETPGEIWTDDNTIYLLDLCWQRFMTHVKSEKCPNYFLPSQNVYHGKIYGIVAIHLLQVLTELYERGWTFILESRSLQYLRRKLESESLYSRSISHDVLTVSRCTVKNCEPEVAECHRDLEFFSQMQSNQCPAPCYRSFLEKLQLAEALYNEVCNDPVTFEVSKSQYHRLSCSTGIALFYQIQSSVTNRSVSNKVLKQQLDGSLHYILQSLPGDISRGYLSIATVLYLIGRPSLSLAFINTFRSKNKMHVLYVPTKVARRNIGTRSSSAKLYIENMCGKSLSLGEKASRAISFGFEAYRACPVLPEDLMLEIMMVSDQNYILSINPLAYSCYLSFLCFKDLGQTTIAKSGFYEMLNPYLDVGIDTYLTSLMAGNCCRMLDDYEGALQYFIRSFKEKRQIAETYSYCGESQSWKSPLVYIALLLTLII